MKGFTKHNSDLSGTANCYSGFISSSNNLEQ